MVRSVLWSLALTTAYDTDSDHEHLHLLQVNSFSKHTHLQSNNEPRDWCINMGCAPGQACCIQPDGEMSKQDFDGGGDVQQLQDACLNPPTTTRPTTITTTNNKCMGYMPGNSFEFECAAEWELSSRPNMKGHFGLAGKYQGCAPVTSSLQFKWGSVCLSKDPIPASFGSTVGEFSLDKLNPPLKSAPEPWAGHHVLPCKPGCPGYTAPAGGVIPPGPENWKCPNDECFCEIGGDPHVYHTFYGVHLEWQAYGNYLYMQTAAGDSLAGFQCAPYSTIDRYQPKDFTDHNPIFKDYEHWALNTGGQGYAELVAQSGTINGKTFAILNRGHLTHFAAPLQVSKEMGYAVGAYALRIGDECWKDDMAKCDCKTGEILGSAPSYRTTTADGKVIIQKSFAVPKHAKIGQTFGGYWELRNPEGTVRILNINQITNILVKDDVLENQGLCANRLPAAMKDKDDPFHGEAIPYASWSFTEYEARILCSFCGLGDPTKGQCRPPAAGPPEMSTPEEACEANDINFGEAQVHCRKFKKQWLKDCLYDYCASGGDERFQKQEKLAQNIAEKEDGVKFCVVPTTTTTTDSGHVCKHYESRDSCPSTRCHWAKDACTDPPCSSRTSPEECCGDCEWSGGGCQPAMFKACPKEGKPGTNRCPKGCSFVDNCEQCEFAAGVWKKDFSEAPWAPRSGSRPQGCFRNRKFKIKCNKFEPGSSYPSGVAKVGRKRGKWPICKLIEPPRKC